MAISKAKLKKLQDDLKGVDLTALAKERGVTTQTLRNNLKGLVYNYGHVKALVDLRDKTFAERELQDQELSARI